MRVYGPYTRKDGRQHVICIYPDGRRRTVSYPKWLMEKHLGRELNPDTETIDHIDGDFTNNDINNLRIIDRSSHVLDDVVRITDLELTCIWYGKETTQRASKYDHNRRANKAGPFCSRVCIGQYGRSIQTGGVAIPVDKTTPYRVYYNNKGTI